MKTGARGSLVVKALDYKLEGRGCETPWGETLNLLSSSSRTMALSFTLPAAEVSTRNLPVE
jgi:hypothetical protein